MKKDERLLNSSEIEYILNFATENTKLAEENIIGFPDNWLSIIKISPQNGLIFISGNVDTGFKHINDRHGYYSKAAYWLKNEDEKYKLDDPSKFSKLSIPILDYVEIVDQLYSVSNINLEKNKDPTKFEMYSAEITLNGITGKYHLLLYKDTKIIHTLFPHKKNHNKKKILNLSKGKVSGFIDSETNLIRLTVPYLQNEGNPVFSFQIVIDKNEKKQVHLIYNHLIKGTIVLHKKDIELEGSLQELILNLEYSDMTAIENIIKDLIQNEKAYL